MPLTPNRADVEALAKISQGESAAVRPYDLSRLIAMGFVEKKDGPPQITQKGRDLMRVNQP